MLVKMAYRATMHEAKTKLSELVSRAQQGEEVIITSGRDRKPVARVVAVRSSKKRQRVPGLFKGMFSIGKDFDDPLPEDELRAWENE
jgi:prevent-host-death family protein